ncbi:UAA transporter [Spinellus fusiger]|nr:UAA transporter [Spinellus fusiger]
MKASSSAGAIEGGRLAWLAWAFTEDMPLMLSLIFGGCCSNVFTLEMLVNNNRHTGHLVTLSQFVFVAMDGLFRHLHWQSRGVPVTLQPRAVPITRWLTLVVLFFTVSVLNNLALGYHISVPLHIIFRSGGLIVNMGMGAYWLKKRYSTGQVMGVVLVTVGVIWATLDNTQQAKDTNTSAVEFYTGIGLLVVAMVVSAGMGLYQEVTYKAYGKAWREGLFYTHFLALPFFLLFYKDIAHQVTVYNASPSEDVMVWIQSVSPIDLQQLPWMPVSLFFPRLWLYLILNMLTQYICIAGVNRMTSMSTSLTLNLILNLRKFTSLLISIVYFKNAFGMYAQLGTALVFLGTLVYARAGSAVPPSTGKKETTSSQ